MKRIYTLIISLAFMVALLPMVGCEEGTTGAPQNFEIAASTDGDQVVLSWDEPTEGTPDEYVVYFEGDTVATTTELTYTHDPAGATGVYKVAAKMGDTEYDSDDLSTVPIHTAAVTLSELNAAGNSGYGWSTTDFTGGTFTMTEVSSAANVDFYLTDFATGYAGPTYSIASPDEGPGDAGGVVPDGSWKISGISDPITDPQAILPLYSSTTYFNFTDLATDPAYLGVYTADGYFALINCSGYNTGAGTIQIETWFQSVQGLRLIAH